MRFILMLLSGVENSKDMTISIGGDLRC